MTEPNENTLADDGAPEAVDGLISRLGLIGEQPLEQRAGAFATIHDELSAVLEGRG